MRKSKEPPRSTFEPQSGFIFGMELASRIATLLGIFLSVLYFIMNPSETLKLSPEKQEILNITAIVSALFLAFLADSIITSVSGWVSRRSMMDSHDQILASIESSADVHAFASQEAFQRHLINRIGLAVEVRNTFVSFRSASGNPNAEDDAALSCYKKFLEGGSGQTRRTWIDVVSYNELFGPRYAALNRAGFMTPKASSRHVLRVIRHNIPLLNFTLIYYDTVAQPSEVVFGWMHSDVATHHKIFRSVEPSIIEMFERLFNLISQYKIQPDFDISYGQEKYLIRSDISNRSGYWYCIGFVEDKAGSRTKSDNFISESLFCVSFKENGAEVEGRVKWKDNYGSQKAEVEHFSHKSDKVSYTEQKMFLEYRAADSGRKGICVYNFKTQSERGAIEGYLQDSGEANRVHIFGIRLEQEDICDPENEKAWEAARKSAKETHLAEYMKSPINSSDSI